MLVFLKPEGDEINKVFAGMFCKMFTIATRELKLLEDLLGKL